MQVQCKKLKCDFCGNLFTCIKTRYLKRFCSAYCRGRSVVLKGTMKGVNKGERNGLWKGNIVGYGALHAWIKRTIKKSSYCDECKIETSFLDLANISQKYLRDVKDWQWLCRKCHMLKDGRLNRFKKVNLGRKWTSEQKSKRGELWRGELNPKYKHGKYIK